MSCPGFQCPPLPPDPEDDETLPDAPESTECRTYWNTAQTYTAECADDMYGGESVTVTVSSKQFMGTSQDQADELALSAAQELAEEGRVCTGRIVTEQFSITVSFNGSSYDLSALPEYFTFGADFDGEYELQALPENLTFSASFVGDYLLPSIPENMTFGAAFTGGLYILAVVNSDQHSDAWAFAASFLSGIYLSIIVDDARTESLSYTASFASGVYLLIVVTEAQAETQTIEGSFTGGLYYEVIESAPDTSDESPFAAEFIGEYA